MSKNFLYWRLPVIFWGAVILVLTSVPTLHAPSLGMDFEDKVYHFLVYFVFGLMLARAGVRNNAERLKQGSIIAAVIGSAFGVLDEWHQYYIPGRSCDVWDAVADILGVLAAIFVFNLSQRTIFIQEERLKRMLSGSCKRSQ